MLLCKLKEVKTHNASFTFDRSSAHEAARRCQTWTIWGTTIVATVVAIQHIPSVNCTIQTMAATRVTLCQVIAPGSDTTRAKELMVLQCPGRAGKAAHTPAGKCSQHTPSFDFHLLCSSAASKASEDQQSTELAQPTGQAGSSTRAVLLCWVCAGPCYSILRS